MPADGGLLGSNLVERLGAVGSGFHLVIGHLEYVDHDVPNGGIVVDDEDLFHGAGRFSCGPNKQPECQTVADGLSVLKHRLKIP